MLISELRCFKLGEERDSELFNVHNGCYGLGYKKIRSKFIYGCFLVLRNMSMLCVMKLMQVIFLTAL